MWNFLARRLLLMPFTLVGVTLVTFFLVALSPGGVTGEGPEGGAAMDSASRARERAYFDDRYGLDEPLLVQYGRWLARVSPLKFGGRSSIDPATGERLRIPRRMALPSGVTMLEAWATLEREPTAQLEAIDGERRYREAWSRHAADRAAYLTLTVQESRRDGPRRTEELTRAWARAEASRLAVGDAIESSGFARAGVWVVPGIASVDWPDLGRSLARGRAVASMVGEALVITLWLNGAALVLVHLVAAPAGLLAAVKRGTWIDRGASAVFIGLWSMPAVWLALLLQGTLTGPRAGGGAWLFPVSGLRDQASGLPGWLDAAWHACLPIACLSAGGLALLARHMRSASLEALSSDYVRTARAKGLPERRVLVGHVLRNSLLPMATMLGSSLPAMVSGSVVVERVFNVPGMGWLLVDAVMLRDRELLMGCVVVVASVTIVATLLADVLASALDPRVTLT